MGMDPQAKRAELKTSDGCRLVARRLRHGDEEALKQFNASLSKRTRELFLPHAYSDDIVRQYAARSERDEDRIYILLDGSTVVGYFFLWYFKKPIPLLGIGLADAYHGRGLGKQMMAILIEDAREANRTGIELTTAQDNDRAFALYRKVGFTYQRDVENLAGDGRIIIERAMFLPLVEGATAPVRTFKPPV